MTSTSPDQIFQIGFQIPCMNPLFGPVGPELIVVLLLIALLFGPRRLPKLGRSVGESLGAFKKGRQETDQRTED